MLDSRRLALLVGVAKEGTIAAAAAAMGLTPSSASEHLSKLERELGVALLERSPRSVKLTAAGAVLVEHGRLILTQLDSAERAVAETAGLSGGRLRVASYYSGASRLAIPSIGSFLRRHPHVQVTFDEMEPEVAIPAVRQGDIDVAVVHHYSSLQAPDTESLEIREVGRDPFVLAVPDRLAVNASSVSIIDFKDAPWVSLRPSEGFQAVTELAAGRAGFQPRVVARADYYRLILELVAAGIGVALIPSQVLQPQRGVQTYQLDDPAGLARQESIITRTSDLSKGTEELVSLISERAKSLAQRR